MPACLISCNSLAQGLSNQGTADIVPPYSLALTFDAPMTVQQLWNWQAAASANRSVVGMLSQVRRRTIKNVVRNSACVRLKFALNCMPHAWLGQRMPSCGVLHVAHLCWTSLPCRHGSSSLQGLRRSQLAASSPPLGQRRPLSLLRPPSTTLPAHLPQLKQGAAWLATGTRQLPAPVACWECACSTSAPTLEDCLARPAHRKLHVQEPVLADGEHDMALEHWY